MPSRTYDIAILSDLRFPGGTAAAIADEIRANSTAGYRTALINIRCGLLKAPRPINPVIRSLIDVGLADLVDPDSPLDVGLAMAHNPRVFETRVLAKLSIRAEERLLIAHHPPSVGAGVPHYDPDTVNNNVCELFQGECMWAPVGPTVRTQLAHHDRTKLLEYDWHNFIEVRRFYRNRPSRIPQPIIGRHSRPDPLKWPDTRDRILSIYPNDPDYPVHILGGGQFLQDIVGTYPTNWKVWEFDQIDPADFLSNIDFFVYFHHSQWTEAFGRAVIEAMAAQALVIVPPVFKELFDDAAIYCREDEALSAVRSLTKDHTRYADQIERARDAVETRFDSQIHVKRVRMLIGPRSAGTPKTTPSGKAKRRRALFVTSNGIGMGHLTRALAIARRCSASTEPIIVTMSQAIKASHQLGFRTEYIAHHSHNQMKHDEWNRFLEEEIRHRIDFYDANVLIFDGNVPYSGLIGALEARREVLSVWIRRSMWRAGTGQDHIAREGSFDFVVEPGEIAGAFDNGLTLNYRTRTECVDPILLLDKEEHLSRSQARSALSLKNDGVVVLLALGAGANFDYSEIRSVAVQHVSQIADLQVAELRWMISSPTDNPPAGVVQIDGFPLAKYLSAFDFAISTASYNSYHELIEAQVPTIFVPNENPMMDDQLARSQYAERHGIGRCLRTRDIYKLRRTLDDLMREQTRSAMRDNCARVKLNNGANRAAQLIDEMVMTCRADI